MARVPGRREADHKVDTFALAGGEWSVPKLPEVDWQGQLAELLKFDWQKQLDELLAEMAREERPELNFAFDPKLLDELLAAGPDPKLLDELLAEQAADHHKWYAAEPDWQKQLDELLAVLAEQSKEALKGIDFNF